VRKPKYGTVDKLQDLTGVRTVTKSVQDSKRIADQLAKEYPGSVVEPKLEPKEVAAGGYRAIHMIIRDHDGLEKEIQIQTERQRAFQEWSHDVYKPQNEAQTEAVGTEKEPGPFRAEALAYGEAVSLYFYNKDQGRDSVVPPRPHPHVMKVFGVPKDV
jgi:ppGpp synthetase/RelA/SpoT-type nucleotidyltranferase